jgi:hypothetical protein
MTQDETKSADPRAVQFYESRADPQPQDKVLDLTVPPPLLGLADEVIE